MGTGLPEGSTSITGIPTKLPQWHLGENRNKPLHLLIFLRHTKFFKKLKISEVGVFQMAQHLLFLRGPELCAHYLHQASTTTFNSNSRGPVPSSGLCTPISLSITAYSSLALLSVSASGCEPLASALTPCLLLSIMVMDLYLPGTVSSK